MSSTNSRIAKNTVFLYIRMLIVMGVTLYTSRVVLSVLGIDNFGIYNLVGGIVVLFTFLSVSMTTATQRFLCISIGDNSPVRTQCVFSSSLIAHLWLIGVLLVLAETLGLWFVMTQLKIPTGREFATHVIYQLSILTAISNVYRIPFTSAILAYEKMSFYAWNGIVEVLLKLLILWPLTVINDDKLILYGVLMLIVNIIILAWQAYYTHFKLDYMRHNLKCAKGDKVKEIFSFAAWNSLSALANIGSKQGLNILVNMFMGVAVNAAVGIMNQVSNTVFQFIQNFMAALNPPLIKDYSRRDFDSVRSLLVSSSKFSFFLILVLATPVIFNIEPILQVWLKEVPPYTGPLCVMALFSLVPNTIGGPIWTIMQASGKIQKYQMVISSIIILNIPCFYIMLKLGIPVYYTLGVQFATNLAVALIGAKMSVHMIGMRMRTFMLRIIARSYLSLILCWIVVWGLALLWPTEMPFGMVCCKGCVEVCITCIVVMCVGLNKSERAFLRKLLHTKLLHKKL
ncbi:MAG: MATE family efflux transporter [Muribaculaceae bacterium]|nr:MATE family efflux transporter [Muribaculaceae bacterium]